MATSITILKTLQPPLRWVPEKKEITEEFLRSKSDDPNGPSYEDLTIGDTSVLQEAQRILGRCLPPSAPPEHSTGLVVGYVQSGKTMSFETVISLARDNGYGVVIVLAGTKNNLRDQSEDRLKKDLGIDEGENWYHYSNPTDSLRTQIGDKLAAWKRRPEKKAVLITVLKHGGHLEKLSKLLEKLSLEEVPALIVDDESDQASLNTKAAQIQKKKAAANEMSATYEKICMLRDVLPHHSYLQYTATPQANLLLAQTDLLNASFAELVTPGEAYTGGKEFFGKNTQLVKEIFPEEVPSPENELSASPKSLLSALRYFLLASAHHSLTKVKKKDRNRSMMVHPAMQTSSHKLYITWIERSFKTLKSFVQKQYRVKPDAVASRFQAEYDSLKITYPAIKPLNELVVAMVDDVLDEVNHVEVNGTKDAEKKIDWKATPYWILVGGAKLDRGYTVEGLCVTYMPRPLGTSPAADTLQQRARFFGYKRAYLGMCRVFVQKSVSEAFAQYVEHEEFVRAALEKTRGKPLIDWRRDFVLTSMLHPTRANVIGLGLRRIPVHGWMVPDVLQRDDAAAEANRVLLCNVERKWKKNYGEATNASEFSKFRGVKESPHFVLPPVPLKSVLEDFLLEIRLKDPTDAEEHSAMLIALATLLRKKPDLSVDVFLMNNLVPGYRTRVDGRGVSAKHRFAPINQYFSQSAATVNDRTFCSEDRVSLQLRRFDLGTKQRDSGSADIKNVTWFALNVPRKLRKDLLIEKRP